ncbi:MAG: 50S ribosomal protein L10 [Deltaproteobacteria bacterium]|nr:MAG: 50S ribosomal protein L10 [Deltaproteobacteria bacterium]
MNREQKEAFIEDVREQFLAAPLVILTDWKGSTVAEMDTLRRACEPVGVQFRVVKNTLCRRAVQGTELEPLSDHFKGNIGVFFAGEDPIAAAKLFREQKKENEKLICRVGFFEGTLLDEKGVDTVADLPSREELLVTLLRTIQEGPRRVLGVLQGPARDLLYLLNNYAAKLEDAG